MSTTLPRSTFVMGAVTLALFGVAIYETATGKQKRLRGEYDLSDNVYEDDEDRDGDDSLEQYSRQQQAKAYEREYERRKQEAAEAEVRAARQDQLKKLFDAEIALPGTLFRGVRLDDAEPVRPAVERGIDAFANETHSTVGAKLSGDRVARFEILPGVAGDRSDRDVLCNELETMLVAAWGDGLWNDRTAVWTNKTAGTRAVFQNRTVCKLVFERFDEPAQWLNTYNTSTLPLGWVGKPAAFVEKAVGVKQQGETITWTAHGLGAGTEPTKLVAWVAGGKIAHIIAHTEVLAPTRDALDEHLRTTFGKPASDDASGSNRRLEWPSKKLVVVLGNSGGIAVMMGKP